MANSRANEKAFYSQHPPNDKNLNESHGSTQNSKSSKHEFTIDPHIEVVESTPYIYTEEDEREEREEQIKDVEYALKQNPSSQQLKELHETLLTTKIGTHVDVPPLSLLLPPPRIPSPCSPRSPVCVDEHDSHLFETDEDKEIFPPSGDPFLESLLLSNSLSLSDKLKMVMLPPDSSISQSATQHSVSFEMPSQQHAVKAVREYSTTRQMKEQKPGNDAGKAKGFTRPSASNATSEMLSRQSKQESGFANSSTMHPDSSSRQAHLQHRPEALSSIESITSPSASESSNESSVSSASPSASDSSAAPNEPTSGTPKKSSASPAAANSSTQKYSPIPTRFRPVFKDRYPSPSLSSTKTRQARETPSPHSPTSPHSFSVFSPSRSTGSSALSTHPQTSSSSNSVAKQTTSPNSTQLMLSPHLSRPSSYSSIHVANEERRRQTESTAQGPFLQTVVLNQQNSEKSEKEREGSTMMKI
ncbi:uncharacterized protein MONOS_2465 [Monocercomonoides exilis]|uniref:uncharacterized protein n=1 Tax=Monocercomonoides exilis TaxID=2049356 RepID=UPI00355AA6CB|nr:hypothetical protein MONOS_2465 [Monocercomonoides exilis]|eukprot:MONOS_2465.1-p1 / transcript=MONOS_2465.1 / gene=MONOS_2465 / organism=Monocercomonoides_exilis_PA203 / gene_product=unspecified product / transcript_product=unspecified product / location=Mono_scaffold00051:77526-79012(+) / protein_length=473 / sequence_SO=supercontig / SO=protein_coding / is_pseudo=false